MAAILDANRLVGVTSVVDLRNPLHMAEVQKQVGLPCF